MAAQRGAYQRAWVGEGRLRKYENVAPSPNAFCGEPVAALLYDEKGHNNARFVCG
jgi:hypothetical protein